MAARLSVLLILGVHLCLTNASQTWYEYYTEGGRQSGLVPYSSEEFLLNDKSIRIVSGAIHYFRVHPFYWRDRLKKLRAAGLNTVETYVPWNLHEPRRGEYDFGQGNNDMSMFLDLPAFIKMAQEEDLFVILRPGPYICAEWEFGGLPSWLQRDPEMQVRTSYRGFVDVVDRYFDNLIPLVVNLQFTQGDGPIIAFQVENEYGAFGVGNNSRDTEYLIHLRDKMVQLGVKEMFFTSDTPSSYHELGTIPGVLQTANFKTNPDREFDLLEEYQPGKPHMVAEFWTGWFDHWLEGHHVANVKKFTEVLERILIRNGSVNFYMFHGGTTFGFMNGANILPVFPFYVADVSSYDYAAPLSEAGDYSVTYPILKDLIARFNTLDIVMPPLPAETNKMAYPEISFSHYLTVDDLIQQLPTELIVQSFDPIAMEDLPINNNNGQSYGFILYRKKLYINSGTHQITAIGHIRDLAVFLLNGEQQSSTFHNVLQLDEFGYWSFANRSMNFTVESDGNYNLDLMVENMGRNNFGPPGYFHQKKGIHEGPILLDDDILQDWTIFPLEMQGKWMRSLTNWNEMPSLATTPTLYKATLTVEEPNDTFILTEGWGRGVVFINGFNIGRFSSCGPTGSLFVPGPLLNSGENTILVMDLFRNSGTIVFSDRPQLGRFPNEETTTEQDATTVAE